MLRFVTTFVWTEQTEQPEWEIAADEEHLVDQEEVERTEVCNGLGEEGQLGLWTQDTPSSKCVVG